MAAPTRPPASGANAFSEPPETGPIQIPLYRQPSVPHFTQQSPRHTHDAVESGPQPQPRATSGRPYDLAW